MPQTTFFQSSKSPQSSTGHRSDGEEEAKGLQLYGYWLWGCVTGESFNCRKLSIACLFVWLVVCLVGCLFVWLVVCLFVCLFACVFVCLLVCSCLCSFACECFFFVYCVYLIILNLGWALCPSPVARQLLNLSSSLPFTWLGLIDAGLPRSKLWQLSLDWIWVSQWVDKAVFLFIKA